MSNNFYKYCILQYKHSPNLEESITLGLLIFFGNDKSFSFKYSRNLSRIKGIYENVPEKVIKEYLRQIDRKLQKFDVHDDIFHFLEVEDLPNFISKYLLPLDGTVLQFGQCKSFLQYDFKNDFIEDILVKKHFVQDIKFNVNQPKEPELAQQFYKNFQYLNLEEYKKKKKFFVDYIVRNETGSVFKFDYAWQNGTLNLVKPISFDLKEAKSIEEKAYRNIGQFIDLEQEAEKNNFRFDLIVGRPTIKSLYKEYDHALYLLEKLKNTHIVEEKVISQYSQEAIQSIVQP